MEDEDIISMRKIGECAQAIEEVLNEQPGNSVYVRTWVLTRDDGNDEDGARKEI
jgi:hypothetical protein